MFKVGVLEELLLQDAENYRKYLRMNTDAFEVSDKFKKFEKIIMIWWLNLKNVYFWYFFMELLEKMWLFSIKSVTHQRKLKSAEGKRDNR